MSLHPSNILWSVNGKDSRDATLSVLLLPLTSPGYQCPYIPYMLQQIYNKVVHYRSSPVHGRSHTHYLDPLWIQVRYYAQCCVLFCQSLDLLNGNVFRKQRRKDVSKFHIQLCIALFFMLLFFVVGVDRTENNYVCTAMSILILYFTIASVCWMGAEAVLMFQKLILVLRRTTNRQIVIISIITWCES